MTRFFRSKSSGIFVLPASGLERDDDHGVDEIEDDQSTTTDGDDSSQNPISTPRSAHNNHNSMSPVLDILATVLRKSLVTCSVERDDVASMDIGWPTEVKHVSHVTFDRFHGFLGLPTELEPEVLRPAPSASASVFGIAAKSLQCSYDDRGNSVPTILLMMQKRLYAEGGLKAEGIFRINPENSQEEMVRRQLNGGVVPQGIDVHCLAGLIKAWFRELPTGVLDLLTPEQVMRCKTEDDCTRLVHLLPPMQSGLLDWTINLMADVVEHEEYNKMNARNVAMVFAPNMTQMADPLTALMHAVQVMNFLKSLILKNLREREQADGKAKSLSSFSHLDKKHSEALEQSKQNPCRQNAEILNPEKSNDWKFLRVATLCRLEAENEGKLRRLQRKSDFDSKHLDCSSERRESGRVNEDAERLSKREGVGRLYRHPVFQLSKAVKKTRDVAIVNTREEGRRGGEACAS